MSFVDILESSLNNYKDTRPNHNLSVKKKIKDDRSIGNTGYTKCTKCGRRLSPSNLAAEADHVFPYSKGGLGVSRNRQTLCRGCGHSNSDSIWRY